MPFERVVLSPSSYILQLCRFVVIRDKTINAYGLGYGGGRWVPPE